MSRPSPDAIFRPGLILYKSCGKCRGDMCFETEHWGGQRWGEFTCIQCGLIVPEDRARYCMRLVQITGDPLRLSR